MKAVIKCKMCDKEFSIIGSNFFVKQIEIDSEKLDLLILKCPFCSCETIAQIDSVKTHKLLDSIVEKMRFVSRAKLVSEQAMKRQSAKLKNLNAQLDQERKLLVEKYKDILLQKYNLDYYFDF
nr:MAG TPA: zinc-ribbon protein [Caudoviricetes sp.]